jgi:hypothetical protein
MCLRASITSLHSLLLQGQGYTRSILIIDFSNLAAAEGTLTNIIINRVYCESPGAINTVTDYILGY